MSKLALYTGWLKQTRDHFHLIQSSRESELIVQLSNCALQKGLQKLGSASFNVVRRANDFDFPFGFHFRKHRALFSNIFDC